MREKKKKTKRRAPIVGGSGLNRPLSESSSSATDQPTSPVSVASASDFAVSESTLTSDDEHRTVVKSSTHDDGFQSGISTPVFSSSNILSDAAESVDVIVEPSTEASNSQAQIEPTEVKEQETAAVPPADVQLESKIEPIEQVEIAEAKAPIELIETLQTVKSTVEPIKEDQIESIKTSWASLVATGKPKVVEEAPVAEPIAKPPRPLPTLLVVGDVQDHIVEEPESFHIGRKERKYRKWRSSQSESQEVSADAEASEMTTEMETIVQPPEEAPIDTKEETQATAAVVDVENTDQEIVLPKSTHKAQQKAAKSVREVEQRKRRSRLSESEKEALELAEAISENRPIDKFLPPVEQHLKNLAMDSWPKTPSSSFDAEEKLALINQKQKPKTEASTAEPFAAEQPIEVIQIDASSAEPANTESRESSFERAMEKICSLIDEPEIAKVESSALTEVAPIETLITSPEPVQHSTVETESRESSFERAMETIGSLIDEPEIVKVETSGLTEVAPVETLISSPVQISTIESEMIQPVELITSEENQQPLTVESSVAPDETESREYSFEKAMETFGSLLEDQEIVPVESIPPVESLMTTSESVEKSLEGTQLQSQTVESDSCEKPFERTIETIGTLLDDIEQVKIELDVTTPVESPVEIIQPVQPPAMSWATLVATGKTRTTSESNEKTEEEEMVRPKRPLPTLVVVGDESQLETAPPTATDPESFKEVVGKKERRLRKWRSSQSESQDCPTDDELHQTTEAIVTPIETVTEQEPLNDPVPIVVEVPLQAAETIEEDKESIPTVVHPIKEHKKHTTARTSIPVKETEQRRKRSKLSESEKEALDMADEIEHGKPIPQLHYDLFADSWPLPLYVLLRQAECRWKVFEQQQVAISKLAVEQQAEEEIKVIEDELPAPVVTEVKPLSWAAMVALAKPSGTPPPPPPPLPQAEETILHHRVPPLLVVVGDQHVEPSSVSDNICPEDEDGFRECVGKGERRRRKWRLSQSESQETDNAVVTETPAVSNDDENQQKVAHKRSDKVKTKRQRETVQPCSDAYWVDKLVYSDLEKAWHESLSSNSSQEEEENKGPTDSSPPGPPKPPSPGDPGSRSSDDDGTPSSSSSQQQQPPPQQQSSSSSNDDSNLVSGKANWSDESTYLAIMTDDADAAEARRRQLEQHKVGS